MIRDELFYRCKNRARNALLRRIANGRPLNPDEHDEEIALIRLHTGAAGHVVENAYNEALSELGEKGVTDRWSWSS